MCPLGTLAMNAIPLSQLQDSIRMEVKWASQSEWGTYDLAAASTTGCTISNIKLHVGEVRIDGAVERAMMDMLGGVVTMPTFDYSHFRSSVSLNAGFISMQIPVRVSSACNLFIILRESLVATPHTRKQITQRTKAGVYDRLSVSSWVHGRIAEPHRLHRFCSGGKAFPQGDSLSDGISTQLMHVVLESKIAADNPALFVDVYVQHGKILIV
ncbi:hypothetical protein T492DRAFT_1118278 [Pavlovales sp. CCMP2436]|nr:hypothetical protein T492DRAFT_1118278 [Pavlovales sp. CCMP2436]